MHRLTLVLAAISINLHSPAQQPIPAGEQPGFNTIQQDTLRRDLTYISSDELAGRMSLQPGDDLAIQWIAEQFLSAGLQPAATDASGKPTFLQPVTLVEYRPDRANSTVTLTRGGTPTIWKALQAFGTYKTSLDVSAPVFFAGFGITAPELGYDDYAGVDAHGKIVLLFDHEPQEDDSRSIFNGTGNTRYATARVKILNA